MFRLLTPADLGTFPLVAFWSLLGEAFTVRCMDWRVSSGEERLMTAAGGGLLAVPRLGRVEEAVGVALGAVRFARDRSRGIAAASGGGWQARRGQAAGEEEWRRAQQATETAAATRAGISSGGTGGE
jgi:hypothetical protein